MGGGRTALGQGELAGKQMDPQLLVNLDQVRGRGPHRLPARPPRGRGGERGVTPDLAGEGPTHSCLASREARGAHHRPTGAAGRRGGGTGD